MHLRRRWVVVTAAWATPLAWITIALLSGPSDGTVVSSPTAWTGAARWDETVTVLRVYGDTRLPEGDVVLAVDNRTPAQWATGAPRPNGRSANASATASVVRRRAWTGSSTST